MKELYPMHGIITTVNTPFQDDLSINWSDLRRTAEATLDAGVAGFLAPCFASEIDQLTEEERYRMAGELVAVTKSAGHGIVIPNVRGKDREACVEQTKRYLDLGVDGINIFMPTVTEESYRELVASIDALHPPFLCLQDTKDNELKAPFVKSMFDEFDSFRCIKIETENPGRDYTAILAATEGQLNVSGSWGSDQMIEAYDRGIHALMPSGLFELFVNSYRLYHEKSREAAMRLFFAMLPIIVFTRQSDSVNLSLHKMYFHRLGLYSTVKFRGEYTIDAIQERYANAMIDRALWLRDHMEEYWK
ncbi:MAG: dihydrodipicolinate synthase family protein [Lawsonibacter sp.]|nr:dihydrodipicolinate synthase family protein [Lawsonibacter sp.]